MPAVVVKVHGAAIGRGSLMTGKMLEGLPQEMSRVMLKFVRTLSLKISDDGNISFDSIRAEEQEDARTCYFIHRTATVKMRPMGAPTRYRGKRAGIGIAITQ